MLKGFQKNRAQRQIEYLLSTFAINMFRIDTSLDLTPFSAEQRKVRNFQNGSN